MDKAELKVFGEQVENKKVSKQVVANTSRNGKSAFNGLRKAMWGFNSDGFQVV